MRRRPLGWSTTRALLEQLGEREQINPKSCSHPNHEVGVTEVSDEAAAVSQGLGVVCLRAAGPRGWDAVFRGGCQLLLANNSCPDVAGAASAAIYSPGKAWRGHERCSAPAGVGFRVISRGETFPRWCWAWEILISGQTLAGRTSAKEKLLGSLPDPGPTPSRHSLSFSTTPSPASPRFS